MEKVERVFERARMAADEAGIELRLSGTLPRTERNCDFIVEGNANVSRDGEAHPCYFLWHRFQCHSSTGTVT
jgi:MoaA/NifB/PqqE/SkfB family radical SAM enzyme